MGNEEELRQILSGYVAKEEEDASNVASVEEDEDISNKVNTIKGYQSVSQRREAAPKLMTRLNQSPPRATGPQPIHSKSRNFIINGDYCSDLVDPEQTLREATNEQ